MTTIRKRLTYANVMSSLAVFLMLGGATAFAATQLAKNSVGTKQLKKNAVTTAKVKNKAITAAKLSASAKNALKGATGATGPQGQQGPQGEPGPLAEVLPSGKTERGAYGFAGTRASGGGVYTPATETSYPIPLSFTPTVQIVKAGAPSTAQCSGSTSKPSAAAGYLCIYEQREDVQLFIENSPAEGHFGFLAFFEATEGSNYEDHGTWAVTAP